MIVLDLHSRESRLCILTKGGELLERRIVTSRERFTAVLGDRPPARILLEASTESEWGARRLESLRRAVILADPIFKTGNCRMRYLLVAAAWRVLRSPDPAACRHSLRHVARWDRLPRAAGPRGRGGLVVRPRPDH
jgi:hypothetical protein